MFFRRSLVFNLCTQNKNQYRSKYEWVAPVGHDTGIKIYNEIVKKKVPLKFPNPKYVKWYMCGPTVYDASHIGHASCYIRSDIIRRVLMEYYNINAVVAIGVTNVSEKIIQRSKELDLSPKLLAEKYELEFFTQMKELNILPPSLILRVKDNIPVISNFILKLVDKGAAYKTVDGSIYFKTAVHPDYGRFKTPVPDDTQEMVVGKLNPLDFALWKSSLSKADKTHLSKGLPGWHIQCSAMASHVFGESVDIHSGGADLIFPHHENEESQSTSYHDCQQWVNYWLHTGLINMGQDKMSKSLNNYISISEFLQTSCADHLRMFCMMTPYRKDLNYDQRTISLASNICDRVIRFLSISDSYVKGTWVLGNIKEAELLEEMEKSHDIIMNHLSNDFGVHEALKSILALIKTAMRMLNEDVQSTTARSPAVIASLNQHVHKFFKSFGFVFAENARKNEAPSALEALVDATVNFRMKVREKALSLRSPQKEQVTALCDESRDNLNSIGVVLNDLTPSHTYWSITESKCNNGSTIKNVIDVLVWFRSEVRKLIPFLPSTSHQDEFLEICRCTKMHLSTLGVIIDDFQEGRSSWSFPKADDQASSKYEIIINSTVKFYGDVRRIAMSITNENSSAKAKEDLLALCDTATSNLESFGVIINNEDQSNSDWMLEVNNNKGKSVVQNVMDMLMGSRDQVKSLALLAECQETISKLDNICYKTKKFLTSYGLNISDPYDRNNPTKWRVDAKAKNKKAMLNGVIDVLVMFMNDVREAAEPLEDAEMKKILLEICNGLEKDLRGIGVTLVSVGEKTKWTFKECQRCNGNKINLKRNDFPELTVPKFDISNAGSPLTLGGAVEVPGTTNFFETQWNSLKESKVTGVSVIEPACHR